MSRVIPWRLIHLDMVTVRRRLLSGLVLLGGTSFHVAASAQSPTEQMLAQSLFEEGRALMAEQRYAEACPKLVESQRLDPGGGTLLNVALCHELEGRLGTAFMDMNAALMQARKDGRQDRIDVATTHLASLGERIPKLTIRVVRDEPGLEVFLDGTTIRRPAWNVATIVDPGSHIIEARAPDQAVPFRMTVDIREREQRVVDVMFASAPATPAPPAESTGSAESAGRAPRKNPVHTSALALGLGGLVVTGVAGLGWVLSMAERKSECQEERSFCTSDGHAALDRERVFGWVTLIGAAAGVGGLITAQLVPKYLSAGAAPTRGGATFALTASF